MTWKAYQVAFRLHSPIHVGWRKLGNLQQTRPYLMGRTLWGALTARITRENGGKGKDYEEFGKKVDNQLIFTYFYPSVETDPEKVTLWPWQSKWDKFAWTFLGSYVSSALIDGHSAEEGSLHETEYIAPYTRDKEPNPVYLVGYIFEKDGCNLSWKNALTKLQFGGERGYGWGRISLVRDPEPVPATNNTIICFGYSLSYTVDHPVITVPKGKEVLAHIDTKDVEDTSIIEGTIEPLIGRETRVSGGFGKDFSKPEICWMPGSNVSKETSFQVERKGIWKPLIDITSKDFQSDKEGC